MFKTERPSPGDVQMVIFIGLKGTGGGHWDREGVGGNKEIVRNMRSEAGVAFFGDLITIGVCCCYIFAFRVFAGLHFRVALQDILGRVGGGFTSEPCHGNDRVEASGARRRAFAQ